MPRSSYKMDSAIQKWLLSRSNEDWSALPVRYRVLLARRFGLEQRGAQLGLTADRLMSPTELAGELGVSRQNVSIDVHIALRFLMARVLQALPPDYRIFPDELVTSTMNTGLRERPVGE